MIPGKIKIANKEKQDWLFLHHSTLRITITGETYRELYGGGLKLWMFILKPYNVCSD